MTTLENHKIFPNTLISQNTLTIKLRTDYDDDRPVFIAGNFNDWQTQSADFRMEKVGEGLYEYNLQTDSQAVLPLLYKFTKGDWSEVEIDKFGKRTENRVSEKTTGEKFEIVERWRRNWLPFRESYLPQIQLISDEFEMPQLNRKRKIWALLPYNYNESSESYPVLYLQDAQNLFNENAAFGNWEIDKKLAVMSEYKIGKIIIIAIEHAEQNRIKEYNVGRTILGDGQGKKYIRFVTDTLKPFIDNKFRTKPDRENTGIGGSSMGALVSIFGGLLYPEVYGKLMIFSPSLWVFPKLKFAGIDVDANSDTKIYLYAGGEESKTMVEHVKKFRKNLVKHGFTDKMKIKLSINLEGKHNEVYWSDEFPIAIEWLFFNQKE